MHSAKTAPLMPARPPPTTKITSRNNVTFLPTAEAARSLSRIALRVRPSGDLVIARTNRKTSTVRNRHQPAYTHWYSRGLRPSWSYSGCGIVASPAGPLTRPGAFEATSVAMGERTRITIAWEAVRGRRRLLTPPASVSRPAATAPARMGEGRGQVAPDM